MKNHITLVALLMLHLNSNGQNAQLQRSNLTNKTNKDDDKPLFVNRSIKLIDTNNNLQIPKIYNDRTFDTSSTSYKQITASLKVINEAANKLVYSSSPENELPGIKISLDAQRKILSNSDDPEKKRLVGIITNQLQKINNYETIQKPKIGTSVAKNDTLKKIGQEIGKDGENENKLITENKNLLKDNFNLIEKVIAYDTIKLFEEHKSMESEISKMDSVLSLHEKTITPEKWKIPKKATSEEFVSLSVAYSGLRDAMVKRKIFLTQEMASYKNYTKSLEKVTNTAFTYSLIQKEEPTLVNKYQKIFVSVINTADSVRKEVEKTLNKEIAAFDEYQNNVTALNAQIDKIHKDHPVEDDKLALEPVAGLNQIMKEQGITVPEISIMGSGSFNRTANSSVFGDIKLFTGGGGGSRISNSPFNLFVAEASTYGFMANFNFGFVPDNKSHTADNTGKDMRAALNVGVYFLGKKLKPAADSTVEINTGVFHLKTGIQMIVIKKLLAAYLNVNAISIGSDAAQFSKFYNDPKKLKGFLDFGLSTMLSPPKDPTFRFHFDLGFIVNGGDVKDLIRIEDRVIPKFRISLAKSL